MLRPYYTSINNPPCRGSPPGHPLPKKTLFHINNNLIQNFLKIISAISDNIFEVNNLSYLFLPPAKKPGQELFLIINRLYVNLQG